MTNLILIVLILWCVGALDSKPVEELEVWASFFRFVDSFARRRFCGAVVCIARRKWCCCWSPQTNHRYGFWQLVTCFRCICDIGPRSFAFQSSVLITLCRPSILFPERLKKAFLRTAGRWKTHEFWVRCVHVNQYILRVTEVLGRFKRNAHSLHLVRQLRSCAL